MNCLLFFALFIVTLNLHIKQHMKNKYIGFLLGSCKTWIADHKYQTEDIFLATTPIIIDA